MAADAASEGAERLRLFSPPNRLPPKTKTNLPASAVKFVSFRVPAKPVFPFHLHRSRGPGKQQRAAASRNHEEGDRDMTMQTIPRTRLIPYPANVRKIGIGTGIEELAPSILMPAPSAAQAGNSNV